MNSSKLKYGILFILSVLLVFFLHKSGKNWMERNCTALLQAPSCSHSFARVYLLPAAGFVLFYGVVFYKKWFSWMRKWDQFLDSLSPWRTFSACFLFVLAATISLFYVRFSFVPLNPFNTLWLLNGGDWSQNYMGWFVFRHAPWLFPWGVIDQLNYPMGTTIGYTDSIPFLALIFKLFRTFLPENFQYFGFWLFSCYVLQALFSSLLVKNWQCKFFIKVMASLLIAFSPVLFFRYGHITLNCHWMILASFCIYFSQSLTGNKKVFLQSLLLCFSAWIHPYFTLMLSVLYFAVLANAYLNEKKIKWIFIASVFTSFIFVLVSWYLIGYFHTKGFHGAERIAFYSTNLNALFNPLQGSSLFLNAFSTEGGQYEGFAYLGAGLLILFFVVCFENWPDKRVLFVKKNAPLLIGIACLTLLALSNTIQLGRTVVLSFSFPNKIEDGLSTFRSVGRFIWPFWYFLALSIVYFWVNRSRNKTKKFLFLAIVLFIQIVDLYPMYKSLNLESGGGYPAKLHIQEWHDFMGNDHNKILTYPPFQTHLLTYQDYRDFWYMAAIYHLSVNNGYLARNNEDLEKEETLKLKDQLASGRLDKDAIYVFGKKDFDVMNFALKKDLAVCKEIDGYQVCKSTTSN